MRNRHYLLNRQNIYLEKNWKWATSSIGITSSLNWNVNLRVVIFYGGLGDEIKSVMAQGIGACNLHS